MLVWSADMLAVVVAGGFVAVWIFEDIARERPVDSRVAEIVRCSIRAFDSV